MKTERRFWPAAVVLGLTAGFFFPASGRSGPKEWDLHLSLQASGRYQIVDRGVTTNGDYTFTLTWEGTMEEDADDFRLVQGEVRLPDWEAHEVSSATSIRDILVTSDFPEKPFFRYFYVLKEGSFFQIAFGLEGFDIPVHPSAERVRLDLPRTAGGDILMSDIDYDAHIKQGSNVLKLSSELIYGPPVERTFAWSWGHRRWLQTSDQILFSLNDHKAKVKVFIRPRAACP
jgi:hypothetical protein